MFQVLFLAIFLSCAMGEFPLPQAPRAMLTTWQQQDPKQSSPETQPSGSTQQPPISPAAPAKPADKPKKVITNDDLKHPSGGFGFSPTDFNQINNCDRSCFEQVRQLAHVFPAANPNWKRDLLQAIDEVRKDGEWQKYLRDLYDMHLKFCQLGDEKRDELARDADPNNVTTREIAIDDKYDAKFKEAQSALQALTSRQTILQRKFADSPFAYQFANMQASRIQNANCAPQRYYNESPTDAEDQ